MTLFAPQILHKPLFSNALGNMQCPQEHLKTIVYAKFGGQTKCIMGNSKIENGQICYMKDESKTEARGTRPVGTNPALKFSTV